MEDPVVYFGLCNLQFFHRMKTMKITKNLQNITFSVKRSKSPLKMCIIVYCSEYVICCSHYNWFDFYNDFFVTHGLGPIKRGPRAAKPMPPPPPTPYVENDYRIKVKTTFMLGPFQTSCYSLAIALARGLKPSRATTWFQTSFYRRAQLNS